MLTSYPQDYSFPHPSFHLSFHLSFPLSFSLSPLSFSLSPSLSLLSLFPSPFLSPSSLSFPLSFRSYTLPIQWNLSTPDILKTAEVSWLKEVFSLGHTCMSPEPFPPFSMLHAYWNVEKLGWAWGWGQEVHVFYGYSPIYFTIIILCVHCI